MHLTYERLKAHPLTFLRLTGLHVKEFDKVITKILPDFIQMQSKKLCPGRTSHLTTLEDKVLCVLIYYRTYITHVFLGYLFNLHNANICRVIKKMEPLLADKVTITKDRSLTSQEVLKLLADVTEHPTQRPIKKQKRSYSGKKRRHTIKTEIVVREDGKILSGF